MGTCFNETEMARASECRDRYAQKCLTPPTLLERRFIHNHAVQLVRDSCSGCTLDPRQSLVVQNKAASTEVLALGEKLIELRHLLQVSLTIFRSVTRRSPYSSLPAAFSTWPSFFSSAFSCALDSR